MKIIVNYKIEKENIYDDVNHEKGNGQNYKFVFFHRSDTVNSSRIKFNQLAICCAGRIACIFNLINALK